MSERSIILNAYEVLAILDGRKTQIRRPIKPQPVGSEIENFASLLRWCIAGAEVSKVLVNFPQFRCPFGQPGDLLWVRETWQLTDGCGPWRGPIPASRPAGFCVDYDATDKGGPYGWRPSTHMPRWASRIALRVKAVRVEREQDGRWVWVCQFERVESEVAR